MQSLSPVKTAEREIFMDVLRGFAILGIFIANLGSGFSWYWLKYFNHGPLEWLWRSATYKKWQPMRKNEIKNNE